MIYGQQKILLENPQAIKQLHLDYLYAGADCIITATYQATFQGLRKQGLSHHQATDLMLLAVNLATEARDEFWGVAKNRVNRFKPLVAASIGPYGAYLADGSEYNGEYGLTSDELIDFHFDRWKLMVNSEADFLLCETTPSIIETRAYSELAKEFSQMKTAVSFSAKNSDSICDGTKIDDFNSNEIDFSKFIGLGINCTSPQYIPNLIKKLEAFSQKPIIIYPNSGEIWHAESHCWTGTTHPEEFGTAVREWRRMGAAIIGGCCRTGPSHIQAISSRLRK